MLILLLLVIILLIYILSLKEKFTQDDSKKNLDFNDIFKQIVEKIQIIATQPVPTINKNIF